VTRVRQMLGDPARFLSPATTVAQAASIMLEAGADALAVVDRAGQAVGIVTGSDLIRVLADFPEAGDARRDEYADASTHTDTRV
jgi:CBS domain-containing protein